MPSLLVILAIQVPERRKKSRPVGRVHLRRATRCIPTTLWYVTPATLHLWCCLMESVIWETPNVASLLHLSIYYYPAAQSTKAGLVEKYHVVPEVFYKNEEYAHIQSKLHLPTSVRVAPSHSPVALCLLFLTFSDKWYLVNATTTIRQLKMVRKRSTPLLALIPERSLPRFLGILTTNQWNQLTGKDLHTYSPDCIPRQWYVQYKAFPTEQH
jgi:hypothetical protein